MDSRICLLAVAALFIDTDASPGPTRLGLNPSIVAAPLVTPSPHNSFEPTRTLKGRGIVSNFESDVSGVLSSLGSNIPSYVASGVPQWWENIPTGTQVMSSLGLNDGDLAATPTSVQNFPPYANWTDQGWNVRFHGNIYRQPNTSIETLNDRANDFLLGTSIEELPPDQAAQARNVTAEIFIVQDGDASPPIFTLEPSTLTGASGQPGGGGAVTPNGGSQVVKFAFNVTTEGDFDQFVPIQSNGLADGNQTNHIQRLDVFTNGTDTGNATAYLVPPDGLTIVSDIDDILRITEIWDPEQIIDNTFARPYVSWMNMPDIYRNWSESLNISNQATHFHYLTTLPEQVTRNYEQFIYATYPGGSFDTRPLNFSDVTATLSIRKYLLNKIFETYPLRKFILVADTSNSDVMRDYPAMVSEFPGQVQCIFLRNSTATSSDYFPYDTSGFKGINQQQYMFFVTPDDLMNLDIANGNCYNNSVPQNVSFGYEGLPFGLTTGNGQSSAPESGASTGAASGTMSLRQSRRVDILVGASMLIFLFRWLQ